MKLLNIFLGITLFAAVSPTLILENEDICDIERLHLIHQHNECVPDGYSLINIFEQIRKTAFKQLSRYAVQQYVKEFCAKTDNATACYNDISVTDRCQNSAAIINQINTLKFVETALKFMCESEGHRFTTMLNDDGAECYANNTDHIECMENEMARFNLDTEMFLNVFLGQNTCKFIQAGKYCLYTYDSCANKLVKYHMTELNKVLYNEYQC